MFFLLTLNICLPTGKRKCFTWRETYKDVFRLLLNNITYRRNSFWIKFKHPSYVSLKKYAFNPKGANTVPVQGIDDKRQTTATFTVSVAGKFPWIQLMYEGKTRRCLPKFDFRADFNVTFSDNHWSNTEKSIL